MIIGLQKFVIYTLTLLVFLAIQGCATREKLELKLESWLGNSADDLIDTWGYPDSTIKAPNGNMVYIYKDSKQFQTPNTGYIYSVDCDIAFELSESQTVILWNYRGNGCMLRHNTIKDSD